MEGLRFGLVTLDIETIPPMDREPNPDDVKAPGNYKDPEKIKAFQEENAIAAYRKLSLNPLDAQVCVIGCAWQDEPVVTFAGLDEKAIFTQFEEWLQSKTTTQHQGNLKQINNFSVCGHNIANFDLPILFLRGAKYGLYGVMDLANKKPFDEKIMDTMRMAFPTLRNEYVSMDVLCSFFGLEGKGEIDGSMVYDLVLEGRLPDVANYCADDVNKTRQLLLKLI